MIMAAISERVLSSKEQTKLCYNGFAYDFDKFSSDGSLNSGSELSIDYTMTIVDCVLCKLKGAMSGSH